MAGHATMRESDRWSFALGLVDGMAWIDYIGMLSDVRRAVNMPPGLVPAAFLVADVGGVIVGRSSIRFRLDDWLAREGGHIGYGVLPGHRRKGYGTEILQQSLVIARSQGIDPSLLCCDADNVGSAAVIERCGGLLESTVDGDDGLVRRYWVS